MSVDSVAQTLHDLVIDENKVVTYKTLSRLCSIHVNLAKKTLEEFLNSEEGLNASFLLSGSVKKTNCNDQSSGYYVAVVPDTKLEEVKAKFEHLDSCHVYSVQKALLKDSSILYAANNEQDMSCGKVHKPVIRNATLINNRKIPAAVASKSTPSESLKKEEVKSEPSKLSSPQNGMVHTKLQSKTPESKVAAGQKGKGAKTNGIMAAFMKGQSTNNKKTSPPAKKEEETTKNNVPKDSPKDTKAKDAKATSEKDVSKKSSPSSKELKKAEKDMWSSESSSDEEVAPPPKRTKKSTKKMSRIKQLPESDSEEEHNGNTGSSQNSEDPIPSSVRKEHRILDDEDEDVIPPTPDENKTARQYVSVKNTYLDEDGFLVTRKERKLEEVELPKPSPVLATRSTPNLNTNSNNNSNKGRSRKTKSAPEDKRKQTNMMSFFTKK